MEFFLGTHRPKWLEWSEVPLCVSRSTLKGRKSYPRAKVRWMRDSGGFTELDSHGQWTIDARGFSAELAIEAEEIGNIAQAAPQDWMCEPRIIAKTGLSVARHQEMTTDNYLELRALGSDVFPVLQGWEHDDYQRHADQYEARGIALASLSLVGVGSVCRRQGTDEISQILHSVAARGIRAHGFGVKMEGLEKAACSLASADSMSWSLRARHCAPLPGCIGHKNCANCSVFAFQWREKILSSIAACKCERDEHVGSI